MKQVDTLIIIKDKIFLVFNNKKGDMLCGMI
ncbi:hypothetical protein SAMN05216520_11475 [Kandleria vitulina]|nr:hypothetical protein SAMN05216520_11475 [Kandleria vitulina]SEJ10449.1 hypothetical protein SAMN05216514_11083 [Kandleria vitulina]